MEDIYSNKKIHYHLNHLLAIKNGKQPFPVRMQLLPTNKCNSNCTFCAYRLPKSLNTQRFNVKDSLPLPILIETLVDFKECGGRATEISGGGEPLLYEYRDEMFKTIIELGLNYALITNGTLLSKELSKLIAPNISWCRVSIDAANAKTYATVKRTPEKYFHKAIKGISYLKKYAKNKEFRLGAGFVVCNENYTEIYDFCKLMYNEGIDLVRLGLVFHPDKEAYFNPNVIKVSSELAMKAEQDFGSKLKIYNMIKERLNNIYSDHQTYSYCAMKDLGIVVGANAEIYTCCILAYNSLGLIGNLKMKTLKEIWNSKEKKAMYKNFNPIEKCKYMCLYEFKNKYVYDLLFNSPIHKDFL